MSKPNQTYYEILMTKLKSYKILAIILIFGITIISIENFTGAFHSLYKRIFEKNYLAPVISTRYYFIHGHGLSLLLLGSLDKELQKHIGGKPIVWKNSIYVELCNLHNKFAKKGRFGYAVDGNYKRIDDFDIVNTPLLPRTLYYYTDHNIAVDDSNSNSKWYKTILYDSEWDIFISNDPNNINNEETILKDLSNGELSVENLTLQKEIDWLEAAEFFKITGDYDFFKYIVRNGHPKDFFKLKLYYDLCRDDWIFQLRTPLLSLQVLVIENLTDGPITINKLIGKLMKGDNFVVGLDELKIINSFQTTLADGVLKKNEVLIVPTNIIYTWERSDPVSEYDELDWDRAVDLNIDKVREVLIDKDYISTKKPKYRDNNKILRFKIPSSKVLRFFENHESDKEENVYYIASGNVEKIVANERAYKVQSAFSGSVFISHGHEGGSCPYIFAENNEFLGKILTGRDSKQREGIYIKKIQKVSKKYKIMELEKEISFLKWIRLSCSLNGGTEWYLYPKEDVLHINNENFVTLRQNDSFDVHFEIDSDDVCCNLQVYGYYKLIE